MMDSLIEAVNCYLEREWGEWNVSIDNIDLNEELPLAYTTEGDYNQFEVQVCFNFQTMSYVYYVDGVDRTEYTVSNQKRTMEEFINEIREVEFVDLITDFSDIFEKLYGDNWEEVRDYETE